MNYFIITGTSKGFGNAIVHQLLKSGNVKIFGFSRTSINLDTHNYQHHLVDITEVDKITIHLDNIFNQISDINSIFLINNAGRISPIERIENLKINDIQHHFDLNIVAPFILSSFFLKKSSEFNCMKGIINISSGAAKTPIDGWSCYNSSKASLEMLTECLKLENSEYIIDAFDPGIVDTQMQETIRSVSANQFQGVDKFIEYYEKGTLQSPKMAAEKFVLFYFDFLFK